MSTATDMSFLGRVTDTPAVSFTWQQGAAVGDDSIGVTIFLHEVEAEAAKSTDFEVSVADDEILVLKHKSAKVVQWRLLQSIDESKDPIQWVLHRNTKPVSIEITMRKKEDNEWPCLRKQPIVAAENPDFLFLAQAVLDEYVGFEVPSLPLEKTDEEEKKEGEEEEKTSEKKEGEDEETAEKKEEELDEKKEEQQQQQKEEKEEVDEKKTEEQEEKKEEGGEAPAAAGAGKSTDEILDEVFDELDTNETGVKKESTADAAKKDEKSTSGADGEAKTAELNLQVSLEALMKLRRERESKAYVDEFEALETAVKDNTAKIESTDEAVAKDAKDNLVLISKMKEIIVEKRHIRTLPVTIETLIRVLNLEIKKILTNSGNEAGEEKEEFANDEEKALTSDQCFKRGLAEIQSGTQSSLVTAFHFLRLASLKHNHPLATVILHRMYTQFRAPTKGAFFILRLATLASTEIGESPDTKANRLVGEHIDSGIHPFTALWTLAVYFFQRAAKEGDAQSMMRLSNLHYDGVCHVQRQMLVHPDVRKKFTSPERAVKFLQAAVDRGLSEAYLLRASFHLRGENGFEKSDELAKKWFGLVKSTDPEAASRLGQLFEPKPVASPTSPNSSNSNNAASSFGGGLRGAFNRNESNSSAGATQQQQQQQQQRSNNGALATTNSRPSNNQMNDRLNALSQRSGGDAAGGMTMAAPTRGGGGFLGGAGGAGAAGAVNPWQKRFETAARFAAGAYFLYVAAFPVRLVVLPYFYEIVGGVLSIFGAGSGSGRSRRSMQGGMF